MAAEYQHGMKARTEKPAPPEPGELEEPEEPKDKVDEAGEESFPASDPPGWTATVAH